MDKKWLDAIAAVGEGLATGRGWADGLSRGATNLLHEAHLREIESARKHRLLKRLGKESNLAYLETGKLPGAHMKIKSSQGLPRLSEKHSRLIGWGSSVDKAKREEYELALLRMAMPTYT